MRISQPIGRTNKELRVWLNGIARSEGTANRYVKVIIRHSPDSGVQSFAEHTVAINNSTVTDLGWLTGYADLANEGPVGSFIEIVLVVQANADITCQVYLEAKPL